MAEVRSFFWFGFFSLVLWGEFCFSCSSFIVGLMMRLLRMKYEVMQVYANVEFEECNGCNSDKHNIVSWYYPSIKWNQRACDVSHASIKLSYICV